MNKDNCPKADKIFSRIYRIFGLFTLICFGSYFLKLIIAPEGTFPLFVTLTVMLGVLLPYLFRRPLRARLGRLYFYIKILMSCAMIFYAVTLAILVGYIHLSPSAEPHAQANGTENVYIVFGAKVKKDGPAKTLASRLDAAVDAMIKDSGAVCIVSGGQGPDEPCTEASAMRDYMVERGISSDRIFLEEKASNTRENIMYSTELIGRLGFGERQIICISSDTHIPRIRLMCARTGVDALYIKAETPMKVFLFTAWVREYLSYVKMLLGL
jgi:uncharacterized SAM-binding protein YcdF (DUF218 family)